MITSNNVIKTTGVKHFTMSIVWVISSLLKTN